MTVTDSVRDHAFVDGLTESQLNQLSALAQEVEFDENEVILRAGQQSKHLYLLLTGSVCVEVAARSYTVRVQVLDPGDAFGWSALLDHHDTLFQVRARQACTALCLEGEGLNAVLARDPAFAAEMLRRALKLVAGRVQATEARLGELCGVRMAPAASSRS